MKLPIYLDYMATTPVDPRVAEEMAKCLTLDGVFGNASSRTHTYGWQADEAISNARNSVAALINTDPQSIVFTSGATESINLALKGAARFYQRQGKHIITFAHEHKAVLDTCAALEREGFEVTYLAPLPSGLIDLAELESAMRDDTLMVSVGHVNSEVGTIQDIAAIAELTRSRGILLHVDAAQSVGKLPVDVGAWPVDLLSMSAHKLYGPKGVGALYVRPEPRLRLEPLFHGGGHQRGVRAGTMATHQIVGMGVAFAIAASEMQAESDRILNLRNQLWKGIQAVPEVSLNGDLTHRVPGNLNVRFPGTDAETLIGRYKDLAISSGSACTSAQVGPSHVLKAMGLSDADAHSSIRFGIGRFTTEEEIEFAIGVIES